MPLTPEVGKNVRELTAAHGGEAKWPRKRILAASINAARQRGADIPLKAGKLRSTKNKRQ